MKILRVKGTNLYDCFTGLGWENHSRVKVVGGGEHIIHHSGNYLNKYQVIQLKKYLGK